MPPRDDVGRLLRLAEQHADEVIGLEDEAAGRVAALVRRALEPITRELTRRWVATAGSVAAAPDPAAVPGLRAGMAPVVRRLEVDPTGPVRALLRAALALGVTQALAVLGARRPVRPPAASRRIRDAIAAMPDAVDEAVDLAEQRLRSAETWADMVQVIGALHTAESRSEATARWAVNAAVAEGSTHVAEQLGTERVWVAERTGACLECLAYQGVVVAAGEDFPGGLTFRLGGKTRFPTAVAGPPRHPNCRCRCQPWIGHAGGGESFVDALRREAQRAVLRGDAGESLRTQLGAVDRLLARGTLLPVTVERRARRAVQAGEFPGRTPGREETRTGA
jgi:hypothetical protein